MEALNIKNQAFMMAGSCPKKNPSKYKTAEECCTWKLTMAVLKKSQIARAAIIAKASHKSFSQNAVIPSQKWAEGIQHDPAFIMV